MKYRAEIDGLRAIAVVPVILFHAGFSLFSGGFVGVDVFFVISGYLITTILIEDIEDKRFSILNFYERRARRILPALYVVVGATLLISLFVVYPEDLVSLGKSAISIPFFSSNFFFWSERGYFGGVTELKPLVHTWSLAVEEQYYVVFPLLLLALWKLGSKFFTSVLLTAFMLSLAASYYVTLVHFDTAFYFPFTRAWELLLGSSCAFILVANKLSLEPVYAELLAALGLVLIFYSCLTFDSTTLFPYITALVPTLGTALFIVASVDSNRIKKLVSTKSIVYVGLISYSLYLWHQPILSLARHLELFEQNKLFLIFLTFVISAISYKLVEKPFRDKDFVDLEKLIKFVAFGTLGIILLGSVIVLNDGFPTRYAANDQKLLTQLATYKGYNQARFDALALKQFSSTRKTKIVLVGDSHARDFLNILFESGLFNNYEFSTRTVNSECGNVFLSNYEIVQQYIPPSRVERCKILGRYEGENFEKILRNADEIWLASSWAEWVVDFIPNSIANLEKEYGKPVRIFGEKDFGPMDSRRALSIPFDQRINYTQPVSESAMRVADKLDRILQSYGFYYPLLDQLCGGDRMQCKIFTRTGLLMSADGGHLTKQGAIEASTRLQETLSKLLISRKP